MSTDHTTQNEETKHDDDTLKPVSVADLIEPSEELQETSLRREWQIKKLQEKLGVPRDIAEKMVDESRGSL